MPVSLGFLLHDDAHRREALGPLQEIDVLLAEFDRKAALEALVRPEVGIERLLPGRVHDHDAGDPRSGHLRDDELDDRRVDDREELLRYGPADRKEARSEPARWDHAVADRLQAGRPVAHGRFSALTLNETGSVVRTANPVTARSARRSPDVSTSTESWPLSTVRRSTVGRSPVK